MNLYDSLHEGTICLPIKARTQNDAIQELLDQLMNLGHLTATTKLYCNISDSEKDQNTAVGKGVAYPHCTSVEITEMLGILGISPNGIDYNAPDGQLCHFILLTLSPNTVPAEHRKFISRFRKMIEEATVRTTMLDADNVKDVISVIQAWELNEESLDDLV